jgi:hypothetical protein
VEKAEVASPSGTMMTLLSRKRVANLGERRVTAKTRKTKIKMQPLIPRLTELSSRKIPTQQRQLQ